MNIIGIGSTARVGKDTAGNALVRDLGYTRKAFADSLKELALEADPMIIPAPIAANVASHSGLEWLVKGQGWETVKDRYPLARQFLENLGDGARKVFGADFWVRIVLDRAKYQGVEKLVITDLRKRNEAEILRALGAKLVRINRPGCRARDFEHELDEWTDWDLVVQNDKGIPELEAAVVDFARQLEAPKLFGES